MRRLWKAPQGKRQILIKIKPRDIKMRCLRRKDTEGLGRASCYFGGGVLLRNHVPKIPNRAVS